MATEWLSAGYSRRAVDDLVGTVVVEQVPPDVLIRVVQLVLPPPAVHGWDDLRSL